MRAKRKTGPSLGSGFYAAYGPGGTTGMFVGAGLLLAVFFAVRFTAGSPYVVMQRLRLFGLIPPVFLTTLLITLWYLLIGGAFGLGLFSPCRGREADRYKGGMLFVLLAVLELLWYTCFFVRSELFFAVLLALVTVVLAVGVALCFRRVARLSFCLMLAHAAWLCYLLVVCLIALFRM